MAEKALMETLNSGVLSPARGVIVPQEAES